MERVHKGDKTMTINLKDVTCIQIGNTAFNVKDIDKICKLIKNRFKKR